MKNFIFMIFVMLTCTLLIDCTGASSVSEPCVPIPAKQKDASAFDTYKITELNVGVNYDGTTSDKGIGMDNSQADVIAAYGSGYTVDSSHSADGYILWDYDGGDLEFEWSTSNNGMDSITVRGSSPIKIGGYGVGDSYGAFRAEHGNPSSIIAMISVMEYMIVDAGYGNCFAAWVYLAPSP